VIRRHSLLIASVAFLLACLCCYRSMHSVVHGSISAEQINKQHFVSVHNIGPKAALWHVHHAISIKLTSKNSSSHVRIPHNSWFAYKRMQPSQIQHISSSYVERRIWLINRAILI
jgi:hypothetical protein